VSRPWLERGPWAERLDLNLSYTRQPPVKILARKNTGDVEGRCKSNSQWISDETMAVWNGYLHSIKLPILRIAHDAIVLLLEIVAEDLNSELCHR